MPYDAGYLGPEGNLRRNLNEAEIRAAFESRQGLLWVDISETAPEDVRFLEDCFHFHHLAVEDCLSTQIHPPKIDDFDQYVFVIVHGINHRVESELVETAELAIFLGAHFVVSNHNLHLYSVEGVKHMVADNGRLMRREADFLAHALMDALITNILPTIDRMSEVAEEIEEEVLLNPQAVILEAILRLKRSTLRVHRVIAPQREVMNYLSRGEFPLIKAEARIFYRDIYDRLVRIEDLTQSMRDRADNALAIYLSSVANRQNETMKVLAIVAAIFLPLSLLAGIYGMNYEHMLELEWRWGYFAVLGVMGAVIAAVIWWA